MVTFAEIVDTVDHLSDAEINELKKLLQKKEAEKKELQLLNISEQAMKDYKEGKSVTLETPEEITAFFNQMINDSN